MRQRGLVVALAVLLAVGATGAVFMYVNGVRNQARTGGTLTTVIVATQDITAGSDLSPLIDQGVFKELRIPADAVVKGAVTSLAQLRGQTTTSAILADEQIPTARLSSGTLPGGVLGIQKGFQAVTVNLPAQQLVGGALQQGAHVTVYAQFNAVSIIKGSGSIQQLVRNVGLSTNSGAQNIGDFAVTLIPDARVLGVARAGSTTAPATEQNALVTLELTPQDVQKLVFAQNKGTVWLSLLPPGQKGVAVPPVQIVQLLLGQK